MEHKEPAGFTVLHGKSKPAQSKPNGKPPASDSGRPRHEIASISDLGSPMDYVCDPLTYLIDGFILEAHITMITSPLGQGKSLFCLSMANSIANGLPFAGMKTEQRNVVYLDRENSIQFIQKRSAALGVDYSNGRLKMWHQTLRERAPAATDDRTIEYIETCKAADPQGKAPLFIYDTMSAFTAGIYKENDAGEMRAYLETLRDLTRLGASVIVLHHGGKSEENISRGSSGIPQGIDVHYALKNSGGKDRLDRLTFKCEKQRDPTQNLYLSFDWNGGGFTGVAYVPSEADIETQTQEVQLIALLKEKQIISRRGFEDAALQIGITRSRATDFLQNHVADGKIQTQPGSKNSFLHKWVGDEKNRLFSA